MTGARGGMDAAACTGVHRLALVAATLSSSGIARADVPRCAHGDADLAYMATDLGELSGDTGWFPDGSPAQLRITGLVTGQTTVAMGLDATTCWNDQLTVALPGRPQTGLLDSEYGAALHVYGQIHTSILGEQIDWTGEIPIPFLPTNLLLVGTTTFDPAALPDSAQSSVSVTSPPTSPVVVLSTDLLTAFIDIVGISGGLNISIQGEMTTAYETDSIAAGDGTITSATGGVSLASGSADSSSSRTRRAASAISASPSSGSR